MRGKVCPVCHKPKRQIRHVRNSVREYTCVSCKQPIRIGDLDKWFSCTRDDGAELNGEGCAMFHEKCPITIAVCLCGERPR